MVVQYQQNQDRYSLYMTQQYNRKRRFQSYDEAAAMTFNSNYDSPNQSSWFSPSFSNNSNDSQR